ncbi:MAG: hypothetical protein HQ485_09050 [Acidobacteria bacterium]|nr:hypothetical protein [Acidobacteriota bacterium]
MYRKVLDVCGGSVHPPEFSTFPAHAQDHNASDHYRSAGKHRRRYLREVNEKRRFEQGTRLEVHGQLLRTLVSEIG